MDAEVATLDRRHRRRQETIEEVLDHAADIMAEEGVAGLSLGEIARRMEIRPPSLYVYFPSKNALYDALFERGGQLILETMLAVDAEYPELAPDLPTALERFGGRFARWAIEHPAYAQLLFWRPVPGFVPSEAAYRPAVEMYEHGRARFKAMQDHGLIRSDVDIDQVQRDWTIISAGIVSQQLSNAPDEPFESGRFTSALPRLIQIFAAHYAAPPTSSTRARAKKATTKPGRGHADKR
jgi:AcrR family transcriptional regulator